MLVLVAGSVGCETDSFLDPSMVGRWERTPTELPILERLDVIEDDKGDFAESTEVTPKDLQPIIEEYRFGPGDAVLIEVWDLYGRDQLIPFERRIDARGIVDLGIIGEVRIQGLTPVGARDAIEAAVRREDLILDPVVSVQPLDRRQLTFSIFGGAIGGAGTLLITKPDYRLLQALTDAGGILETVPFIYVIRQVPLSEAAEMGVTPEGEVYDAPPPTDDEPAEDEETLDELLQELESTLEEGGGQVAPFMAPGEVHRRSTRARRQPADEPRQMPEAPDPGVGPEPEESPADPPAAQGQDEPASEEQQAPPAEQAPPPIDLEGLDEPEPAGEEPLVDLPALDEEESESREPAPYIFVNGEWVPAQAAPADDEGPAPDDGPVTTVDPITGEMMTQRIIRVPVKPLLRGEAQYNLIIRPGDVIRVPTPPAGNLYLGGMISRPGTYNLPVTSRMTLKQAIFAAGGFNALAIPERVDLVRRVGETREATVRLNLRAIFEGTEPDLFVKPNDMINVGTNFWAAPLAVARNGFRMTYGFGFLLDRNFGNDVFGPPPTDRFQ
jgi:protein involved in polysaccharide export with SLBB domain